MRPITRLTILLGKAQARLKRHNEDLQRGGRPKGSETETTYVLSEVTADKVVVEVKMTMIAPAKMEMPARKQDIPKGINATTQVPRRSPSTPATPTPNVKQSEEKVTLGGKTYTCQVTETNTEANGMKIAAKTWTCADVPNTLVKSESSTTGSGCQQGRHGVDENRPEISAE